MEEMKANTIRQVIIDVLRRNKLYCPWCKYEIDSSPEGAYCSGEEVTCVCCDKVFQVCINTYKVYSACIPEEED